MARDVSRDLKYIDALDALQAEFRASNPDQPPLHPPSSARPGHERSHDRQLIEAWVLAALGLEGTGPQSLRWARSLGERILKFVHETQDSSGEVSIGKGQVRESSIEDDLTRRLARHPKFEQQTLQVVGWLARGKPGLPPWRLETAGGKAADLARKWRQVLPGLDGLRAWRFMEHLGQPVMTPETSTRRLMFRFGTLNQSGTRSDGTGAQMTSALHELARLSGTQPGDLRLKLRWAARPLPTYRGGGWCSSRPRCADCPLASACLWARFRTGEASPSSRGDTKDSEQNLLSKPVDQLGDVELLDLLLRSCRRGSGTREPSSRLLHRIGELRELEQMELDELERHEGIGKAGARMIKAALELGRRASTQAIRQGAKIQGSEDVWNAFAEKFRQITQEHFIVLLMDTKNRFIKHRIVSRGTLDSSAAHPREVFRQAIRDSASAVILMHNHPSGDPQPSPEDRAVTRQLVEAGTLLGIRVLDHIVLGASGYYSFRDEGEI